MHHLEHLLSAFRPGCAQEEGDLAEFRRWMATGPDLRARTSPAHLTASGWVVSPDRKLVLMAYHRQYDAWAWLGGHVDDDPDPLTTACREVREESGLSALRPVTEAVFSLEVLAVQGHEKRGVYVPAHLHLNLTFLLEGDPAEPVRPCPGENSRVAWFTPEEAMAASSEPWMVRWVYEKLAARTAVFKKGLFFQK